MSESACPTGESAGAALARATAILAPVANDEARLEAEVLLRHVLGLRRAQLYAQLDRPLLADQAAAYNTLLQRRLAHEPVAYLTGHREFFGLDFLVNRHVLIPRPETELLVELGLSEARRLAHLAPAGLAIADVGTGSGCVAISLAVHLPAARVYATDASAQALAVAEENCRRHGVAGQVILLPGDLLAPLPELVHIIVANLPYIPHAELESLPPEIRLYEPRAALDGGQDGLEAIRHLLAEAPAHLLPGGAVLLEIGHGQGQAVVALARQHFPAAAIAVHGDSGGRERVVTIR
jgi:release factor glutamine methyltransferase